MHKDEVMKTDFTIVIIPDYDEGGFAVTMPDLPGCVSVGETEEEAVAMIKDAKTAWVEAAADENGNVRLLDDYSGQFKIRMPKALHHQLVKEAQREGVSMNQYCLYKLAQ